MHIPQRPVELLARLDNALANIVHLINSVKDLIDRQFLEHHVVISERASLVAEQVLDTAQFLRDGTCARHCARDLLVVRDLV